MMVGGAAPQRPSHVLAEQRAVMQREERNESLGAHRQLDRVGTDRKAERTEQPELNVHGGIRPRRTLPHRGPPAYSTG